VLKNMTKSTPKGASIIWRILHFNFIKSVWDW
jgi:hypothetical protein